MSLLDPQDDTQVLLQDSVRDFLDREHRLERLQAIYTGQSCVDRELWRRMAGQGWLALRLPQALGGSELEPVHAAIIMEQFGLKVVPEPLAACAMMPAVLLRQLPCHARWQPVVEGLVDGSHIATLAWQEDIRMLAPSTAAMQAEPRAGGGWRLTGRKLGVICASLADSLLVTARLGDELALWRVASGSAGLVLAESRTSDGGTVAVADFNGVHVPEDALLARGPALAQALEAAIGEAVLLGACQLLGIASGALELTLHYLRTRTQFGKPIGSFQALQHASVDVALQQALARAACRNALRQHAETPHSPATRAAISAAKARASDAALLAGRFGVQAHGAIGFAAEAAIGAYLKAALRGAALLGNGSHHRRQYAELAGLHETCR